MRIDIKGGGDAFVSDTFRNIKCRKSMINEKRHMRMTEIMDADTLDTGAFTTTAEPAIQKVIVPIKQATGVR